MGKNLIAILILFLLFISIVVSTAYKQLTLKENLLNDPRFMKDFVRTITAIVLSIIFLYICCFLNIPIIDKIWMFLQGAK